MRRVVIDCRRDEATVVELTPEEEAAFEAERAPLAAADQASIAAEANADTMRARVAARLDELAVGADALEAGTLTAAQQRALLALTIRTVIRLARVVLRRLEAAP